MPNLQSTLRTVDDNFDVSVRKLLELISIPSISSEASGLAGIVRAAEWLKRELSAMGLSVEIIETKGHPVILAHSLAGQRTRHPRLLFYGHYDVQPVGDLNQWQHPPFEPRVMEEDGIHNFYGRGASDSKSQFWTVIEALRAWRAARGSFPADIVVMLEGEEEAGSPSLPEFIDAHRHDLRCDVAFICDAEMWSPTQPAITTQLKGLVHERVTIFAPNPDLHSGHYGAVAANPIRILSDILAGIHDEAGRVTIGGFYDDVSEIPDRLRQRWRQLAQDAGRFEEVDLSGGVTEKGYSTLEAMWGRPTVDINGITGGNQGPAERSVLPGSATARLSFRLVCGQQPEKVRAGFRAYVKSELPRGCTVEFEGAGGSSAVVLSQDSPFLAAAARGLEQEWESPAILRGTGGAIPLVQQLSEVLDAECVVIGFILPGDAIHAPDERYDTRRLRKGIRSWIRIFEEIQRESSRDMLDQRLATSQHDGRPE
ncbi:M20/M25/M40 family metallo-hydrolase [Mesorhizobium sp. NZP2298]|uniref:M20/M25/M40 family metallo-hydrolase n=1 Tax=Mesorhizobium sp. NZP2298 TaxID=2483403 RepID=UPI00155652CF|nr:M20/M25/M40 family metallo-hydrolase [Mesorhizobium sp. NZP2298]QKC95574.1 M20/M25/M40 family metallo-hydrolase [Mesorhizobium sp. NZP2298]